MKRLGKLNKSKVLVAKTMEEAEKEISVMDGELREKVTAADLKTVISSQTNFVRLSESGTGRKGKGKFLISMLLFHINSMSYNFSALIDSEIKFSLLQ